MKKTALMLLALVLLSSWVMTAFAEEAEAPLQDGYTPRR